MRIAAAEPRPTLAKHSSHPRIELLSVLQVLSDYPLSTPLEHNYKAETQAYFAPFANHRAVTLFREMWRKEFRFNEVPTAIYAFTPPPELRPRHQLSNGTLQAAGGAAKLQELMDAMRDFHRISGFERFFANHQPLYRTTIADAEPAVRAVVKRLESYVGVPLGDTTVVLGPLLHVGGFAATYDGGAGLPEAVAFIGPESVANQRPSFGSAERLSSLTAHEFAHTVVNPLTEGHQSMVTARAHLFPPLAAKMRENGYSTWEQTVYEHIIHAMTARLAAQSAGEAAGDAAIKGFVERGFVYVPALVEKLRVYESNRNRYPALAAFFPELLSAIK